MRRIMILLAVGVAVLAGCSSNTNGSGLLVSYARVDLIDGTGTVTQSVDLVANGSVGPSIPLTLNVPQRLRVTWLTADSVPDPGAADPSLVMKLAIPNASYGLTFVQNPLSRYEGTITSSMLYASPVFIPLQLFDNSRNAVVFTIMAHFVVN